MSRGQDGALNQIELLICFNDLRNGALLHDSPAPKISAKFWAVGSAGLLCCRRPERAQRDVDGDAVVLLDQLLGRG